jgi:DNA-binding CsgD family transcriptional regulator
MVTMIALTALRTQPISVVHGERPNDRDVEAAGKAIAAALLEACDWLDYGLLLVDATARIHYANAKAREQLKPPRLFIEHDRLRAASPEQGFVVSNLIARAARADRRQAKGAALCHVGDLLLQAMPLSTAPPAAHRAGGGLVAVYIVDPRNMGDPDAGQLRVQFGLTTAEATLACEIVKGDGLPESAKRIGISNTTARTHLHRILSKTGTNRQAELVRLVLGSRPIARATRSGR